MEMFLLCTDHFEDAKDRRGERYGCGVDADKTNVRWERREGGSSLTAFKDNYQTGIFITNCFHLLILV